MRVSAAPAAAFLPDPLGYAANKYNVKPRWLTVLGGKNGLKLVQFERYCDGVSRKSCADLTPGAKVPAPGTSSAYSRTKHAFHAPESQRSSNVNNIIRFDVVWLKSRVRRGFTHVWCRRQGPRSMRCIADILVGSDSVDGYKRPVVAQGLQCSRDIQLPELGKRMDGKFGKEEDFYFARILIVVNFARNFGLADFARNFDPQYCVFAGSAEFPQWRKYEFGGVICGSWYLWDTEIVQDQVESEFVRLS
ncbi:hypothetical protein C8R44DRAFT_741562 [Mycena epipterygia]|nr:hypothetical protein C8R44DRAFT_741562 [Mycena epipterygia]